MCIFLIILSLPKRKPEEVEKLDMEKDTLGSPNLQNTACNDMGKKKKNKADDVILHMNFMEKNYN